MRKPRALLAGLLCLPAAPLLAQSYQIDCYGTLASYRLSHPQLNCTCASAHSAPSCGGGAKPRSTAGKYPSAQAVTSATVAATVMGALIGAAFAPSGPSPEEQRLAQQRAEAERRAAEERARIEAEKHRALMGSLVSVPGRSKAEPKQPEPGGVRLTALKPRTVIGPAAVTGTTGETAAPSGIAPALMDDLAAKAWLDNPETLFNAVWKPLHLGRQSPAEPRYKPSCGPSPASGCEIAPDAAVPALPLPPVGGQTGVAPVPAAASLPAPDAWRGRVALLRSQSACVNGICDDFRLFVRALDADAAAGERKFRLIDQIRETGKVLVETLTLKVIGETSLPGKVAVLYYNIYDSTRTTFSDAIKVAGYAGSSDPAAEPPEITPLVETASALSPAPLDDVAGQFDPAGFALEHGALARRLREIWARQ